SPLAGPDLALPVAPLRSGEGEPQAVAVDEPAVADGLEWGVTPEVSFGSGARRLGRDPAASLDHAGSEIGDVDEGAVDAWVAESPADLVDREPPPARCAVDRAFDLC